MSSTYEVPLDALVEATQRLTRTVDALDAEELAAPSALPGWTRAHVIAHLALNAEGLAGVLEGVLTGEQRTMYVSQDARDADIESLADGPGSDLRERLLGSTTRFRDAVVAIPAGGWTGDFARVPGATQSFPLVAIPGMREVEVEVHHADLLAGYSPADWPEAFTGALFERMIADRADGPAARLRTPGGEVALGSAEAALDSAASSASAVPVVTGSTADLTWWLIGRGSGEGLEAEPALPTLGPWR